MLMRQVDIVGLWANTHLNGDCFIFHRSAALVSITKHGRGAKREARVMRRILRRAKNRKAES